MMDEHGIILYKLHLRDLCCINAYLKHLHIIVQYVAGLYLPEYPGIFVLCKTCKEQKERKKVSLLLKKILKISFKKFNF